LHWYVQPAGSVDSAYFVEFGDIQRFDATSGGIAVVPKYGPSAISVVAKDPVIRDAACARLCSAVA